MPTGYTYDVGENGESFEDYAMRCARGMGVCVRMRDEPMSTPIPERFEPSPFYQHTLEGQSVELTNMLALTTAEIEAHAKRAYESRLAQWQQRRDEHARLRERYERVLQQARDWTPPSENHVVFKHFMVEQLEMSIDHDCDDSHDPRPEPISAAEWYAGHVAELRRMVQYYERSAREEVERTASNNEWLRLLRASLHPTGEKP